MPETQTTVLAEGQPTASVTTTTSGPYLGSWKQRRRVIFLSLIFIGADLGYLSVLATDTVIHQQIAIALIPAGVAIIGSYVFGAVWDDHSIRKAMG